MFTRSASTDGDRPAAGSLPFHIFAGVLLFVFLSGVYVTNAAELTVVGQFVLLLHALVGAVVLVPLCIQVPRHAREKWAGGRRSQKLGGATALAITFGALGTGVGLLVQSARSEMQWLVTAHAWTGLAAFLVLVLHFLAGWLMRTGDSGRRPWMSPVRICVTAGALAGLTVLLAREYEFPTQVESVAAGYTFAGSVDRGPFFPSEAQTAGGDLVKLPTMTNAQSCGVSGCHTAIVQQWESSMHRQSFRETAYRSNELDLVSDRGIEAARWCAGCHEPALLLSGNLDAASGINPATLDGHPQDAHFNEGVSCLACHAITHNNSLKGVGSYIAAPPYAYIYADRTEPVWRAAHNLLIRLHPQPHRDALMAPVLKDAQGCASCHKVFIDGTINRYRWLRLQDQYDSWRQGPWSNENFLTFRTQPLRRCADCHMELVAVHDDVAANDGRVANHFFAGANTVIPHLTGDTEQLRRVQGNLKGRLRVRITEVQSSADARFTFMSPEHVDLPLQCEAIRVGAGEALNVAVTVANTGVGHRFPAGTIDAKDAWLEFIATDAAGRVLFHSGYLDPDGTIDPEAHFYRSVALDGKGEWIRTRRMWNVHAIAYARTIPPGAADLTVYRFRVPPDAAGPVKLEARVRYRKLSQPFAEQVAERDPHVLQQPVTDVASDTVEVGVGETPAAARARTASADMLVDYGIGLLREANMPFARRAFLAARELAPSDGRLCTDIGITYYRETDFPAALEWFERARAAAPDDLRVDWYEALIKKRQEDFPGAIAHLERVVERYPLSDLAWYELGRLRYWTDDTAGARDAYERVLAIDPDHTLAYHGLSQCYQREGRKDDAYAMFREYDHRHVDGPEREQLLEAFYKAQPWIATTARLGYIHDRGRSDVPAEALAKANGMPHAKPPRRRRAGLLSPAAGAKPD